MCDFSRDSRCSWVSLHSTAGVVRDQGALELHNKTRRKKHVSLSQEGPRLPPPMLP